jgi:hypothetical protein
MVKKGLPFPQTQKENIKRAMRKFYDNHDGPWKGVKRGEDFKKKASELLKQTYADGHTN